MPNDVNTNTPRWSLAKAFRPPRHIYGQFLINLFLPCLGPVHISDCEGKNLRGSSGQSNASEAGARANGMGCTWSCVCSIFICILSFNSRRGRKKACESLVSEGTSLHRYINKYLWEFSWWYYQRSCDGRVALIIQTNLMSLTLFS
jgi:hypothetical protein